MRPSDRFGLAVMAAMVLACQCLTPVSGDPDLFLQASGLIAVNGLTGIVARRIGLSEGFVHLGQVVLGLTAMTALAASQGIRGDPIYAVSSIIRDAVAATLQSAAPMGPQTSVRIVAVFAIWLLALTADYLTISLSLPAWTLAPLLLLYGVPALILPTLTWFGIFVMFALSYTVILVADAANRVAVLRASGVGSPRLRGAFLAGGASIGIAGILGAAVLGVVTPGMDAGGAGPFAGSGPIQMADPTLDLRRNLEQAVDREVIRYTTDAADGAQLRMTTLPVFDNTGFHLNEIELFSGTLPMAPGVQAGRPRHQTSVAVSDFNTEWLPLPYAPVSFTATGDWRYDPLTLAVLAAGPQQKRATNGLRYSVVHADVSPNRESFALARAGRPPDAPVTTALPDDLPPWVNELADQITRDAALGRDGAKAMAIQNYLRSNEFVYSTEPAPGSGYDALRRFLLEDKRGYCEQFAASMAVLARAAGIPSRVAIGFLPGDRVGDEWVVSVRDMHAWPELYFADYGWVSFEPTPGVASPPAYTDLPVPVAPSPTPSAESPSPLESDSAPSDEPSDAPVEEDPGAVDETAAGGDWMPWLLGGLGVALLVALPTTIRDVRRRLRAAASDPDDRVAGSWSEIRDCVWDSGGSWPTGSPYRIGQEVGGRLDPNAAAAMSRVAALVERSRYAEATGPIEGLDDDVVTVRAALAESRTGRRRLRRLIPRSLWMGFRERTG